MRLCFEGTAETLAVREIGLGHRGKGARIQGYGSEAFTNGIRHITSFTLPSHRFAFGFKGTDVLTPVA